MGNKLLDGDYLTLGRIGSGHPWHSTTLGLETLLYPLTGSAKVKVNFEDNLLAWNVQVRSKIFQRNFYDPGPFSAIRIPAGNDWSFSIEPYDHFDWLYFSSVGKPEFSSFRPVCVEFARQERIGETPYYRSVRHLERPLGFFIDAGETRNKPGQWSSWPSHANMDDLKRLAEEKVTWEEAFFCITAPVVPTVPDKEVYGLMLREGLSASGKEVNDVIKITNSHALFTPLGSHPIVASPVTNLFYIWSYFGTALEKQYNRSATDTGTYVK
jgi:5-deoxy-D-glucuronate isomerase